MRDLVFSIYLIYGRTCCFFWFVEFGEGVWVYRAEVASGRELLHICQGVVFFEFGGCVLVFR